MSLELNPRIYKCVIPLKASINIKCYGKSLQRKLLKGLYMFTRYSKTGRPQLVDAARVFNEVCKMSYLYKAFLDIAP